MENAAGKKLFVLGHARSGTTILGRLLNSAEEVLLLGEAHLFESYWNPQFVSNFNGHHQQTKKIRFKGTRLPAQFAGMLPEAILKKLAENYQWVGEKVAIGPMAGMGARAAAAAVDYFQAYHLDASYILTFRAPLSSLDSLWKLFPKVALAFLLQGWMLSFIEISAASHVLKNVSLAPLELMSFEYWERLSKRYGIAGRADANWLKPEAGRGVSSAVEADLTQQLASELGWELTQTGQFLQRLSSIYISFLETVDPETQFYSRSISFANDVALTLLVEVQDMLAQLRPDGSAPTTLPASVCAWIKQGRLTQDQRVLPLPQERLQRFAGVMRDSLFCNNNSVVLSGENPAYPLMLDGIDMRREGPWLYLQAQPDVGAHRHLTVRLPIAPLCITTVRLRLRRESSLSRYLMLQIGDASGFYKSVFDCQEMVLVSMASNGPVKSLFSHIEQTANGDLRISVSGMLTDGRDSYLRLYLCGEDGSIDFRHADARLIISDLVLSYSHLDCGLEGSI